MFSPKRQFSHRRSAAPDGNPELATELLRKSVDGRPAALALSNSTLSLSRSKTELWHLQPEVVAQLEALYAAKGGSLAAPSPSRGASFVTDSKQSVVSADGCRMGEVNLQESYFKVVDHVAGLPETAWVREVTRAERAAGPCRKLLTWFLITNHTSGAWACRVGYPAVASQLQERLSLSDGQVATIGTAWAVGSLSAVFLAPKVFAKGGPRGGSLGSVAGVPCAVLLLVLGLSTDSFALVVLSHALEGVSAVCSLTFQNVFLNSLFSDGKDMRMAFAWDGVWRSAMFAVTPSLITAVSTSLGLMAAAWALVLLGTFSVLCNCGLFMLLRGQGGVNIGQTSTSRHLGIIGFLLSVRRFKARTLCLLGYAWMFEASWTPLLWFGSKYLHELYGYDESAGNFWTLTVIQTARLLTGPLIGLFLAKHGKRSLMLKLFAGVVAAAPLALALLPELGAPPSLHPGAISVPFGVAIAAQYCLVYVALPVGVRSEDLSTVYTYHSGMMSLGALVGTTLFGVLLTDSSGWSASWLSLSALASYGCGLLLFLHLNDAAFPGAARGLARCDFWVGAEETEADPSFPSDPRQRAVSYVEYFHAAGGAIAVENYYAADGVRAAQMDSTIHALKECEPVDVAA
eukprot:TRINITY_DN28205_c0_g1_i2.p1 TRINITY_DN28205_c0_g1~~TRINITY_DN28205_c0_g1_i2.p1  ORF type:complete len:629 (+),score=127.95 TRINITY_DN28205_c0_g1_i2:97-1983(+)